MIFWLTALAAALPGSDPAALRRENAVLREREKNLLRQLDELSAKLADRENALRRIRVWLANLPGDARLTAVTEREQRLLTAVRELSRAAAGLAVKSTEVSETLRPRLDELNLGSTLRVRLTLALEDLEKSARQLYALTAAADSPERVLRDCRVIGVRPELGVAVVSAGALHGVFPGMTFETPGGAFRLRVLETRPLVSGALAVKGDLAELRPGTRLKLAVAPRAPGTKSAPGSRNK